MTIGFNQKANYSIGASLNNTIIKEKRLEDTNNYTISIEADGKQYSFILNSLSKFNSLIRIKNINRYVISNNNGILLTVDTQSNHQYCSINLLTEKSSYGKTFFWGFQYYFSHSTMIDLENKYNEGKWNEWNSYFSSISVATDINDSSVSTIMRNDFPVAKKNDLGQGTTLTDVLYLSKVHWYNSGDCVR
jgi:hypothetical protein